MARWMIERKYKNAQHEILQLVEVYAENESKELVKAEKKYGRTKEN